MNWYCLKVCTQPYRCIRRLYTNLKIDNSHSVNDGQYRACPAYTSAAVNYHSFALFNRFYHDIANLFQNFVGLGRGHSEILPAKPLHKTSFTWMCVTNLYYLSCSWTVSVLYSKSGNVGCGYLVTLTVMPFDCSCALSSGQYFYAWF
jgi:hypothetical protein